MDIFIRIEKIVEATIVEILAGLILFVPLVALEFWRLRKRVNTLENSKVQINTGNINIGEINMGQQPPEPPALGSISSPFIDSIEVLSQEEYNALPEKKDKTLYLTTK